MEDKIWQKLLEHDNRFEEHDERFENIEQRLDALAQYAMNHEERLERIESTMATKDDFGVLFGKMDEMLGIMKKTDQEHVMLGNRVVRLEEKHDHDIQMLQKQL